MSSTYQNKKKVYGCLKTFNFLVIADSMSSTYQNGEEEKKRGRKKVHIDV
jgi:hypothetical protein